LFNFMMSEYEQEWDLAGGKRRGMEGFLSRERCVKKYGFAIPTIEALRAIMYLGPVLEVGAGSGYWAYEMRKLGGDVVATEPDVLANDPEALVRWRAKWTEVEKLTALEALAKYPERVLFMCWPSYADEWSGVALEAYKGNVFALVAEDSYGCVGGENLWKEIYANWEEVQHIAIPQWEGIHDRLCIYRRK
jgi:hypothetical protein